MKFNSRYSVTGEKPGIKFDQLSQTLQSFKDDAEINCIISRFETTGVLVDPTVPVSRVPHLTAALLKASLNSPFSPSLSHWPLARFLQSIVTGKQIGRAHV